MVLAHLSPKWFFGYDVGFELSFVLITLVVSIFGYKIYKKTSAESVKYFSLAFLLISISYFIQSIFNFLIVSKLNENISKLVKISTVAVFELLGILIHIFFMTIGLSILVFLIFRKRDKRMLLLLIMLSLSAIYYSQNMVLMFYVISTLFLFFISHNAVYNYFDNKQAKTLLIALAFLLLLISNIHFFVAVNHQFFYVIGHFLEFFAYSMVLINLYLVVKR